MIMKRDFDFEEMKKSTPYSAPDGYFDEMQQKVLNRVKAESRHRRRLTMSIVSLLAAAAVIATVVFIPFKSAEQESPNKPMSSVCVKEEVPTDAMAKAEKRTPAEMTATSPKNVNTIGSKNLNKKDSPQVAIRELLI